MPLVDGTWVTLIRRGWICCSPLTTLSVFQSQTTFFIWHKICNFLRSNFTLSCLTPPPLSIFQTIASPIPQCSRRHFIWPQSFHSGTSKNHLQQASTNVNVCDHYSLPFLNPSISTITCCITYLTQHFKSACSVCNYLSGVRFVHRELGLAPGSLDSFPFIALLWAAEFTMHLPPLPLHHLSVLPHLLIHLCQLISILGVLEPSM